MPQNCDSGRNDFRSCQLSQIGGRGARRVGPRGRRGLIRGSAHHSRRPGVSGRNQFLVQIRKDRAQIEVAHGAGCRNSNGGQLKLENHYTDVRY